MISSNTSLGDEMSEESDTRRKHSERPVLSIKGPGLTFHLNSLKLAIFATIALCMTVVVIILIYKDSCFGTAIANDGTMTPPYFETR